MKYLIISDVHANLEALNAVLKTTEDESFDALLFLGDTVGYGPNPNECIETLKGRAKILLAGNHDWAVLGLTDIEYFNPYAKTAIEWTMDTLREENKVFLKSLPITEKLEDDSIYLVHSTPKEPEQWHYLLSAWDAYINFQFFKERICLVGHSHSPVIIECSPDGSLKAYEGSVDFKKEHRYIINVGSVGQPRDGNPRAAYAVLNENSVEIKRVSYDIVLTQRKMREAGLPPYLIERLSKGV